MSDVSLIAGIVDAGIDAFGQLELLIGEFEE